MTVIIVSFYILSCFMYCILNLLLLVNFFVFVTFILASYLYCICFHFGFLSCFSLHFSFHLSFSLVFSPIGWDSFSEFLLSEKNKITKDACKELMSCQHTLRAYFVAQE